MIKVNWYLVYGAAICLDVTQAILEYLAIGIIFGRILTLLATMSFAFYFYITSVRGWGFRLFGLAGTETIPLIGDLLMLLPIEWTILVWRIHKQNPSPTEEYEGNISPQASAIAELSNQYASE